MHMKPGSARAESPQTWQPIVLLSSVLILGSFTTAKAQQTVGLFLNEPSAYEGYTLITPVLHPATYLIDMEGQLVHTWTHSSPFSTSVRLLPDGTLLRASGASNSWNAAGIAFGRVEKLDWDGTPIWEYEYVTEDYMLHHDVLEMPNGNILAAVWDMRDQNELIDAGFDVSRLTTGDSVWSERIVEFKPILPDSAEIVWQWDVWDHIVQDEDPLGPNYGNVRDDFFRVDVQTATGGDWLHFNAVDYNEELDLIAVSASYLSELWIIDHSTTTEEAQGNIGGRMGFGGDLVYRWGNPQNYGYGGDSTRSLRFNHSTQWIPEDLPGGGNLMVFDNGIHNDPPHSTSMELVLPYHEDLYDGRPYFHIAEDNVFGDPEIVWSYSDPGHFYSDIVSGQQRLPNGNTLIVEGMTGRIFEVDAVTNSIVWEYVNPVIGSGPLAQGATIPTFGPSGSLRLQNVVFRALRYAPDYSGLAGRDLTPKGLIELMPTAVDEGPAIPQLGYLHQNYPNPFTESTRITFKLTEPNHVRLAVFNTLGQEVTVLVDRVMEGSTHTVDYNGAQLSRGVYYYQLDAGGHRVTRPMLRL